MFGREKKFNSNRGAIMEGQNHLVHNPSFSSLYVNFTGSDHAYTNDLPLEIIYRLKVNCRKQLGFSCQLLANPAKNPIELTFGWNSLVYMICAILVHKINLCTQYLSLEINFSLYGWQIDNWWPTGTFLKSAR